MNHAGLKKKALLADFGLLLCALFWGLGFVSMKRLVSLYTPCWLLFLRFGPGAILLFLVFPRRILTNWRRNLTAGVIIGGILFAAMGLQTAALNFIGAGRQAFITATYVLLVPLLFWLFRRVFPGWTTLGAAGLCLLGMGLLADPSGPLNTGDVLTFLCAVLFAVQIIAISHYTRVTEKEGQPGCDPIAISFIEFVTLTLLCLAAGLLFEGPLHLQSEGLPDLAFTIVFCTFGSYALQVCSQRYSPPSHAAIIMSLEAVFGLLSGILLLGETLTLRAAAGCFLILASVLIAELEPYLKKIRNNT
ncbi:MAG: DMT family transporter [Fretibacterium sp.]|nr:DMT family transporter [Fretibacterium sp.]